MGLDQNCAVGLEVLSPWRREREEGEEEPHGKPPPQAHHAETEEASSPGSAFHFQRLAWFEVGTVSRRRLIPCPGPHAGPPPLRSTLHGLLHPGAAGCPSLPSLSQGTGVPWVAAPGSAQEQGQANSQQLLSSKVLQGVTTTSRALTDKGSKPRSRPRPRRVGPEPMPSTDLLWQG